MFTLSFGDSPDLPFGVSRVQRFAKKTFLWGNTLHDTSHYGRPVTYLGIKGVVPPSTEGQ